MIILFKNIEQWWLESKFEGSKMFYFIVKLKLLIEKIIKQNTEHFNNIFKDKLDNEEELKNLNEEVIKKVMNNVRYTKEK